MLIAQFFSDFEISAGRLGRRRSGYTIAVFEISTEVSAYVSIP